MGRWYDKMSTLSQKLLLIIFGNYLAYFIHEPKSSLQMKPKRRGCYNWMGNQEAQSFLGCTREKQKLPRTAHSFCNHEAASERGASSTHPLKAIQAAGTRGCFLFFSAKELMNRARGSAFNFPTGNAQHTNLCPQLWR